jgi:hypothetical protein
LVYEESINMGSTRWKFTPEYKAEAVQFVLSFGKPIARQGARVAGDVDDGAVEVDVRPGKAGQLTEAHAGIGGGDDEHAQTERAAITGLPASAWSPAIDADGGVRDGAAVAELTGLLHLSGWPAGMRVVVRRERPHPGAQLTLFEERDGWRYTAFVTNTQVGALQWLEARHRAHARVEDRTRCAKDTGLRRLPSREFAINQAWCTAAAIAVDLIAWLQLIGLNSDLAKAEPKRLRYRILHTAARLVRGQRRRWLRVPATWPWAEQITAAFHRITAIPAPG